MTRTLYGHRIRQPIGEISDFQANWRSITWTKRLGVGSRKFGIDIWMTTEAIASGARVCQSFLGAKNPQPKDPAADLSAMLVQVLGAVFALMEDHYAVWEKQMGSNAVPLFGFQYEVGVEPVNVNVDRAISTFQQGLTDLGTIWDRFSLREPGRACGRLAPVPYRIFRLPTVYGRGWSTMQLSPIGIVSCPSRSRVESLHPYIWAGPPRLCWILGARRAGRGPREALARRLKRISLTWWRAGTNHMPVESHDSIHLKAGCSRGRRREV